MSHGRGVDGSPLDQSEEAIEELIQALRQQTQKFPQTVFLATGIQDVLVSQEQVIVLQNGVPELDCFTGTGDLVGALVAALLGEGNANDCSRAILIFAEKKPRLRAKGWPIFAKIR